MNAEIAKEARIFSNRKNTRYRLESQVRILQYRRFPPKNPPTAAIIRLLPAAAVGQTCDAGNSWTSHLSEIRDHGTNRNRWRKFAGEHPIPMYLGPSTQFFPRAGDHRFCLGPALAAAESLWHDCSNFPQSVIHAKDPSWSMVFCRALPLRVDCMEFPRSAGREDGPAIRLRLRICAAV